MEPKHTLVQYHGGGYDGCFWEWNYFYIDNDGEFHDVQSSGRFGCDTADKAKALLAENSDHTYTYDVTEPSDIADFSTESATPHVLGVLRWFQDNTDVAFFAICTECGEKIEDGTLESWHGCGGVAVTADDLLCEDCYSAGQCFVCNEYVGRPQLDYEQDLDECSANVIRQLAEWDENNGPACQWCWENERDGLIANERQDLLSTSLATGTPDLFSDEMRWFWV